MLAHEDDIVEFTYPDQNLMKNLSSFSFIGGSGYAPYSLAEGDGLKKAILGKDARFIVVLKDQLREQRTVCILIRLLWQKFQVFVKKLWGIFNF